MTKQSLFGRGLRIIGGAIAALVFFHPAEVLAQQVPATVDCSVAQPAASPAINYAILFFRTGRKLMAARGTTDGVGQETFHGSVEPSGLVRMFGMGRFVDGSSSWTFTFASQWRIPMPQAARFFTGNLRDRFGNTRTCMMTVASGLQR